MSKRISLLLLFAPLWAFSQNSELSVEKIMQDPLWMGTFPSDIRWGPNSDHIYFDYNPEGNEADSLYTIDIDHPENILKVSKEEREELVLSNGDFNDAENLKVYSEDGKLFLYNLKKKQERQLLELPGRISDEKFLAREKQLSFIYENNAYVYNLESGELRRLTNIRTGKPDQDEKSLSEQDEWLRKENLDLLQVVQEREEKENENQQDEEFVYFAGNKRIFNLEVSPDASFVAFNLITDSDEKDTEVPDYVDASGYTASLDARSKVGSPQAEVEMMIFNVAKDTVYPVDTSSLPGLKDQPDFYSDYPEKEWKEEIRSVIPSGPVFSDSGKRAVVNVRSHDNKDRWIALLDLETGKLKSLDRQRDEAWIAGPGIGYSFGGATLGWLPDEKHVFYQSEASGYSHLYLVDVETGKNQQLTQGAFEVFDPFLSKDKKHWYLTTSEEHPGERHFYRMPLYGGSMTKLTEMEGNNQVSLSPDEEHMAILHSFSNSPWELYLKRSTPKAEPVQVTSGQSEAFRSYNWKVPEIIQFEARDGASVPARLFKPSETANNGAAVIFVHGAGYLQNAHKWWSSYFREYMFHNLLTDLGYTVLDIDYRGSAGYGRDWRTGIYRHMGGLDLSDQVDGAKYLVEEQGIDPERIGIYGGSYGGFITLMAMFTQPEIFQSGAALRSVTDWAHYNHGYTSNILNEPVDDPIAYRRSSPIYFAEGLEGNLLIAHGMVDTNVHFQDVVRLAQRLIELGKDDWELAVYPVEGHGFVEPSSWTDEYSRILELFNETLLTKD